ncbi:unnamed protein product [Protopolystoma xenopodis]|uniref:Uncharacterized protein n=1 Tax=Protopolystoma xenopodis TaxID=117903 RepID=A0A3S5CFW2_9PLAT|nr:unnamed protein product [Protopolystoma xenopodis]
MTAIRLKNSPGCRISFLVGVASFFASIEMYSRVCCLHLCTLTSYWQTLLLARLVSLTQMHAQFGLLVCTLVYPLLSWCAGNKPPVDISGTVVSAASC